MLFFRKSLYSDIMFIFSLNTPTFSGYIFLAVNELNLSTLSQPELSSAADSLACPGLNGGNESCLSTLSISIPPEIFSKKLPQGAVF